MSYQVFARKTRPRNFSEVVGQAHVLQALSNGLDANRVHHAFLFTGTRGVGKTTIARIFSKALNCEKGVSASPCGECSHCVDIDEGRFVDLIEIDAASRTGVDDIRELIENVQYAPTRGRHKVYLIDEVHMLSNSAFNALLKTLEEPPEHVKFLLATTDPQKIPVTVLSRCLQFNLRRLNAAEIKDHLAAVLDADGISYDTAALSLIARAADGSVRDSLSLLDQALNFGAGKLAEAETRSMLGTVDESRVVALLTTVIEGDAEAAFQQIETLQSFGFDWKASLSELASLCQRTAVCQQAPQALPEDTPALEAVKTFAQQLSAADIQLYYQIAVAGLRDMDLAPEPRAGFEMVMLRMLAFCPAVAAPMPEKKTELTANSQTQEPLRKQAPSHNAEATANPSSNPSPSAGPTSGSVAGPKPTSINEPAAALANSPVPESAAAENRQSNVVAEPASVAENVTMAPAEQLIGSELSSSSIQAGAPTVETTTAATSRAEVTLETAPDVVSDAGPGAASDTGADAGPGAGLEAAPLKSAETSPIATADVRPELGTEVGPETGVNMPASKPLETGIELAREAQPEEHSGAYAEAGRSAEGAIDWNVFAAGLPLKGMLVALAENTAITEQSAQQLVLGVSADMAAVCPEGVRQRFVEIVQQRLPNMAVEMRVLQSSDQAATHTPAAKAAKAVEDRQGDAEASIARDPNIQQLVTEFDGQVENSSIKPVSV